MTQRGAKAKNLTRSLVMYHKRREMAVDVSFARGAEIYGTERSLTYCNGSCTSSRGEAKASKVETVTDLE